MHGEWNRRRRNASTNSAIRRKLGFFLHVRRSDGLEKGMMLAHGDGGRRRGRPRRKWMDEIHEVTVNSIQLATIQLAVIQLAAIQLAVLQGAAIQLAYTCIQLVAIQL